MRSTPHGTVHVSVAGHHRLADRARAIARQQSMLGTRSRPISPPSAFDQASQPCRDSDRQFGAGEHQYAHTDHDMPRSERTTDAARVLRLHDAGLFDVRAASPPHASRPARLAHYRCRTRQARVRGAEGRAMNATPQAPRRSVKLHDHALGEDGRAVAARSLMLGRLGICR